MSRRTAPAVMVQLMDVRAIAKLLRAAGLPATVEWAEDETVDDMVAVTPEVSVQVGETYVEVSRFNEAKGVIHHYGSRRTDADVVAHVRKALADHEAAKVPS